MLGGKRQKSGTLATGLCIYLSRLRKEEKALDELEKTKNELAAAQEHLKVTKEEMDKYK